jgi:hypothetical protein
MAARIFTIADRPDLEDRLGEVGDPWPELESDDYIVPGALVPVQIDRERDEGRYVEPNVWMRHAV